VSPWTIGFYVLAGLGPVMLVMVVTGLRLERRWWSGLWRWPRRGQPARGWWGALHRLAALWSVPFILVIGTTVVWYLVEWDGWVDWNQWGPQITDARPLPLDRTVTGADIDRWVAIARERQPGLVVSGVALPWEPGGTVTVTGQRSALVVRERANAVHIDPVTDGIRAEQIAHAMPVHERWTHTADPLHFGDFAGLWSKLLWVGFGSLLVLVSVSGAVVCLRRVARRPEAP
jgi:uncharacterized iron-regulated membrane protein